MEWDWEHLNNSLTSVNLDIMVIQSVPKMNFLSVFYI